MTPDWKALCTGLIDALDSGIPAGRIRMSPLAESARTALAKPQPEPPTDQELAKTAMQAVENYRFATELPYFLSEDSSEYEPLMLILRAVLARWGQ